MNGSRSVDPSWWGLSASYMSPATTVSKRWPQVRGYYYMTSQNYRNNTDIATLKHKAIPFSDPSVSPNVGGVWSGTISFVGNPEGEDSSCGGDLRIGNCS
jgi:hypothetical protein